MKLVALFLLSFSSYLVPVSTEGRVEYQKLNQEAAELPPGLVFGVQLGLRQTQALIKTDDKKKKKSATRYITT